MKTKRWQYKYPGYFYACGPMELPEPGNERQARAYLRGLDKVARLQPGVEFWPAPKSLHTTKPGDYNYIPAWCD